MKYFAYVWIDIKRLLRSKATWAVVAVIALSPLLTLLTGLSGSASATTLTSRYVSQPAMSGALYSMFLFVLFSLYEISRVQRRNIGSITDSVASPLVLGSAKVLALACVSAMASLLAFLVNLPFAAAQMEVMFDFSVYCQFYFIVFWPTLLFGLLLIAACFQLFYRAELSIALFILAFYFTKVNPWTPYNFLIDWTWPAVEFMSDTFNGFHLMRTAIYNRAYLAGHLRRPLPVFAAVYAPLSKGPGRLIPCKRQARLSACRRRRPDRGGLPALRRPALSRQERFQPGRAAADLQQHYDGGPYLRRGLQSEKRDAVRTDAGQNPQP